MSILAIDFGGTRTRAAWFTADLVMRARHEQPSGVERPIADVLKTIVTTAHAVVPHAARIEAIGICAPGPLDAAAGMILHAATLPGWANVPLGSIVSKAFGDAPTFMQNDANLAALAETRFGALQHADPGIYLTLSTGIGGGAVINGRLFTGAGGLAIEPGHILIPHPDGRVYTLEALASGTALGAWARRRLEESGAPSTLRGLSIVDGKRVGEAAIAGDALALAVVHEAGRWLGIGLATLLHLWNPQAIALGGSVANLGERILASARAALREHLLDPAFYHDDLLRPAALGDDVCLVGAAVYTADMANSG